CARSEARVDGSGIERDGLHDLSGDAHLALVAQVALREQRRRENARSGLHHTRPTLVQVRAPVLDDTRFEGTRAGGQRPRALHRHCGPYDDVEVDMRDLLPLVGTALVWIPLAIELAPSGEYWQAGVVVLVGAGVPSLIA